MSVVQTVLVFVGIPALVVGLLAVLVVAPGAARRPRYRPGEAWDYEPVWYLPQPDRRHPQAAEAAGSRSAALPAGHRAPELTAGEPAVPPAGEPALTARGGVHDTW